MTDAVRQMRDTVDGLKRRRSQQVDALARVTAELTLRVQDAQDAAARGDDAAALAATAAAEDVRTRRRDLLGRLDTTNEALRTVVDRWADPAVDPCDAEPDVPLLLLPVRLETRYSADGATLRVRIYPDDVHVDRLDPGVSDVERAAAITYWNAVWVGGPAIEDSAWQTLAASLHRARASWVAYALTPLNLDQRPSPPGPSPAPTFPDVAPRSLRPPAARGLPDRFVLVARQGADSATAVGATVLDEVVVGLPPGDDPSQLVDVGGVRMGPGMQWMADYAEAVRVGLGIDLALPHPGQPVDRLVAVGVKASRDPATTAADLRQLLLAHRFSDGVAFLAQGTPTNNTETDRSDWAPRPAPAPPPTTVTASAVVAGSAADVLGRAFGGAADVLAGLPGADLREDELAGAAARALWEPGWGTLLDRVALAVPGGVLDDAQREAMRDLFQGFVRGRGPLPTLRVGNQPYGVLPVSSVDTHWVPDASDVLEPHAVALLRRCRPLWRAGLDDLPRVGSSAGIDSTLLEILGSAPQLLALRVRSVASDTACLVVPPMLGLGDDDTAVQHVLDLVLWQTLGLPFGATGLGGSLGKTTRAVGLPLSDASDVAFIAALTSGQPRTVSTVLQALLELALARASRAVDQSAPAPSLNQVLDLGLQMAPALSDSVRSLHERVLAGDAPVQELHAVADQVAAQVGVAGPELLYQQQPVAALRTSLADVALQPNLPASSVPALSLQSVQAWLRAQARLAEVRAALGVLGAAGVDERRVAVSEALDCSSHRLDAWTTAVVSRRVSAQRALTPAGLMLGAYGWVEDIAPGGSTTRDGGYVLAPSVTHAVTSGVLRSAYLHHNPDSTGSGAFAIDLTSSRVRDGKALLDGIRNGQQLGALLGYRFERRLHEGAQGLDRFVLSLRTLAPLTAGKLTGRGPEAPPRAAQEAVAVTDVVDGVTLLDLRRQGTDIRGFLATKPANNPYLTDPWPAPTDAEWAEINAALDDIASMYDAAADLLLAEAVHQLVQGSTARAAATLDAAAGGDALPVDPAVVRTPARGAAVTHRVVVIERDPASGGGGWAMSARAAAEPRLESWARRLLGPPSSIVVQVGAGGARTTLAGTALGALDVVYDAATPGVIERRLRAAMPALGPRPLAGRRAPGWPPGMLGIGEVESFAASVVRTLAHADPLLPPSLARAGEQPARSVSAAALADAVSRAGAARDGLSSACDALGTELATEQPVPVQVARAVEVLAAFGVAVPGSAADAVIGAAVLAEGRRRCAAAAAVLDADTPPGAADVVAAGKAVFGDAYWLLPVVGGTGSDLFASALGRLAPGRAALRRFVRDLASVRAPLARYAESLLLCDALGIDRPLRLAQLAASGTTAPDVWLGGPLDPEQASPSAPVTCVLVESPVAVTGTDEVAGLVIDEWVEVLPTRSAVTDGSGGSTVETVVTAGLAANVDVASARAPQAMLLAVSPDGARWTAQALVDVLEETLELAKLRGVTLERVGLVGRVLPALHEQSWSLQGEPTLDLRTIMTVLSRQDLVLPFVKD